MIRELLISALLATLGGCAASSSLGGEPALPIERLLPAAQEEWDESVDEDYEEYEEYEEYGGYEAEDDEEALELERPRERRPWKGRALAIAGGAGGVLSLAGGYVSLFWAASGSDSGPLALAVISGVNLVVGVVVMITGLVIKSRQDREWLERNPKRRRRR